MRLNHPEHQDRESRACSVSSLRSGGSTVSNLLYDSFTEETLLWFEAVRCTRLGWFTRFEPPQTFSNHSIAERARCVAFFHRRSVWFDGAEPSLTAALPGKQGVQGA